MTRKRKHTSPANSRKAAEARRLANLEKGRAFRFLPGQSGNPSGRPPAVFSKACREKLAQVVPNDPWKRTFAAYFVDVLAHKAMRGDQAAIAEISDRAEGRARVSMEVTGQPDPLEALISELQQVSARVGPPPSVEEHESIN